MNHHHRHHMKKIHKRLLIAFFIFIFFASCCSTIFTALILEHAIDVQTADAQLLTFLPLAVGQIVFPILFILISMLIFITVAKKVVRPIVKLSEATKQVASGNFDVQIEESMRRDEIGQLEKNFNRMVKELQGNEYLRKDFIANATHEFRTPLAVINGYARLLEDDSLSKEEQRQYIKTIEQESERLNTLTENILRITKLDNQQTQHSPALFSLDEQIRQSVLLLEKKWLAKDIAFNIDLASVEYLGEEELLFHVWNNLLDNAIKYSNPGGTISVIMPPVKDDMVCVQISDQGIGMAPETISRIFEQFYQEEQSHEREGSGIGLALVKRIVELHQGTITVESIINEGSAFCIYLPVTEGDSSNKKAAQ